MPLMCFAFAVLNPVPAGKKRQHSNGGTEHQPRRGNIHKLLPFFRSGLNLSTINRQTKPEQNSQRTYHQVVWPTTE